MHDRPSIPEPVRREVRQRCGFACIFCGLPVYEFDHIVPWAEVHDHNAENLVLLCPNHHAEFTRNQRSREDIVVAAQNPHNLRTGTVQHIFHVQTPPLEVVPGTNTYVEVPRILVVDDEPLISVENLIPDGTEVGVTASIFNQNQDLILRIERNEWVAPVGEWDLELVGPRLTIRSGRYQTQLQIRVEPPSRIVFERGQMYYRGWALSFSQDSVTYQGENQLSMRNVSFRSCSSGLVLNTVSDTDGLN